MKAKHSSDPPDPQECHSPSDSSPLREFNYPTSPTRHSKFNPHSQGSMVKQMAGMRWCKSALVD